MGRDGTHQGEQDQGVQVRGVDNGFFGLYVRRGQGFYLSLYSYEWCCPF